MAMPWLVDSLYCASRPFALRNRMPGPYRQVKVRLTTAAAKPEGRMPVAEPSPPSPRASSSSAATGRSGRSAAAAPGSVWLARDEQTGLEVALKIVPREGKAGSRAEREAPAGRAAPPRALPARLRARARRRHVYIAYEYVPGETLRDAIARGRLDDRDAVEAAAQVLDGLAHAHERGIVHRDVKPANVLLAEGRRLGSPARLRARADRRGGDADRRRRRPGHARVHLAGAAARRGAGPASGRLGRRRPALGRRSPAGTRSGPRRCSRLPARSSPARRRWPRRGPTCRSRSSRRRLARSPSTPQRRPTAGRSSPPCCRRADAACAKPASRGPRAPPAGPGPLPSPRSCRPLPPRCSPAGPPPRRCRSTPAAGPWARRSRPPCSPLPPARRARLRAGRADLPARQRLPSASRSSTARSRRLPGSSRLARGPAGLWLRASAPLLGPFGALGLLPLAAPSRSPSRLGARPDRVAAGRLPPPSSPVCATRCRSRPEPPPARPGARRRRPAGRRSRPSYRRSGPTGAGARGCAVRRRGARLLPCFAAGPWGIARGRRRRAPASLLASRRRPRSALVRTAWARASSRGP